MTSMLLYPSRLKSCNPEILSKDQFLNFTAFGLAPRARLPVEPSRIPPIEDAESCASTLRLDKFPVCFFMSLIRLESIRTKGVKIFLAQNRRVEIGLLVQSSSTDFHRLHRFRTKIRTLSG